jgi:ATP-binding protein involved in chromosome partitioning
MNLPTPLEQTLKTFLDPYLNEDYLSLGWIKKAEIENHAVLLHLQLGYPAATQKEKLKNALCEHLKNVSQELNCDSIEIQIDWRIRSHAVQAGVAAHKNIKNIIAVASGKGGVGKSTVAVNLALALQGEGAKVGILDADIYGPSQPTMLGIHRKPDSPDGKTIEPIRIHGLQAMSIGFLVEQETAMIWRGPMVSSALQQLLNDTSWRDLDYLILDLPPGTGDIQLTMAQKVPVASGIIVTTPQNIALQDAIRGLRMFEKVNIPVLGIIENMSTHLCSNCGHLDPIFGEGGGEHFATEYNVPLLGKLPLDAKIREHADAGYPTVIQEPESTVAEQYRDLARKTTALLAKRPINKALHMPKVVVK